MEQDEIEFLKKTPNGKRFFLTWKSVEPEKKEASLAEPFKRRLENMAYIAL